MKVYELTLPDGSKKYIADENDSNPIKDKYRGFVYGKGEKVIISSHGKHTTATIIGGPYNVLDDYSSYYLLSVSGKPLLVSESLLYYKEKGSEKLYHIGST